MMKKTKLVLFTISLMVSATVIFSSCKDEKPSKPVSEESSFQTTDPVLEGMSVLIREDPGNSENYFVRANELYERSLYDAAIKDLKSAISIDSTKAEYYHLLSDAYLDYFKSGEALDVMNQFVQRYPERIPSLLKLSELQLILKQYDASFFTIQKILNIDKQNAEAFFMMGMIYRAQDETERAINSFQTAVELDPEISDAWIILGDMFAEKDFKIAEKYYDNAIRLDPENPQVYHSKAFYLQNKNRSADAIALYKKINEMDPQYTDAYLNTGILYLEMDSLAQAFEHFDIMVKIDPQNFLAYYYRGITRMFRGDGEGARRDLEQSLKFNSGYERAIEGLKELDALER